jgi:hypothetical protein
MRDRSMISLGVGEVFGIPHGRVEARAQDAKRCAMPEGAM